MLGVLWQCQQSMTQYEWWFLASFSHLIAKVIDGSLGTSLRLSYFLITGVFTFSKYSSMISNLLSFSFFVHPIISFISGLLNHDNVASSWCSTFGITDTSSMIARNILIYRNVWAKLLAALIILSFNIFLALSNFLLCIWIRLLIDCDNITVR